MEHNAGAVRAKEMNQNQSDSSPDIWDSLAYKCPAETIKHKFCLNYFV